MTKEEIEKVIKENQGIVGQQARYYSRFGVDFEDLVSEGNLGLLIAAGKFDPNRKLKFITYAVHWVRARMTAAVEKAHRVHNSTRLRKVFWKGSRVRNKLIAAGLEGNIEQVAEALGLKPELVEHATTCMATQYRLDATWNNSTEEDERSLYSRLASPEETPEAIVLDLDHARRQREAIPRAMEKLSPKARKVLHHRFERERTLQETGNILGISRERVRQIEMEALAKMRRYMAEVA